MLRIEANTRARAAAVPARAMTGAMTGGARGEFAALVNERRAINTPAARMATPIEGLLALQAGETPAPTTRRRARKGLALLETLDDLKADMLAGRAGEGTLDALAVQIDGLGPASRNAGLEATMRSLELRVRVELAKREAARGEADPERKAQVS